MAEAGGAGTRHDHHRDPDHFPRAQGLVEYGLILVLVSVAAIVIMQVLGTSVISLYSQATTVFPGA